jgi:hypothetical protein
MKECTFTPSIKSSKGGNIESFLSRLQERQLNTEKHCTTDEKYFKFGKPGKFKAFSAFSFSQFEENKKKKSKDQGKKKENV